MPFPRPVTIIDNAFPVPVRPSGEEVTVYPVMAELPPFIGAVNVTVAWPAIVIVADTPVGTPGTVGPGAVRPGAEVQVLVPLPPPLPHSSQSLPHQTNRQSGD